MTHLVVDASVVVKWLFPTARDEPHADRALAVLADIRADRVVVVQPPHWLAEVTAVLARVQPSMSRDAIALLHAMELQILNDPEVYTRASELAAMLGHHVFDTLYHAVALIVADATLVTADERYWRKSYRVGRVQRLRDYTGQAN